MKKNWRIHTLNYNNIDGHLQHFLMLRKSHNNKGS